MAHKKKPYVKGLYRVIEKGTNKELYRNLTMQAIEKLVDDEGVDYCEVEDYWKIICQSGKEK